MRIRIILLILLSLPSFYSSFSQRVSVWGTYAHSKFIHSPGIETAVFLTSHVGLMAGLNTYIAKPNNNQLSSYFKDDDYWYAYGGNLDFCYLLLEDKSNKLAVAVGGKYYYGNYFVKHHYYPDGDYYIYYDLHRYIFDWGVDFGLAYYHNKLTFLLKYDTARHFLRFGAGYSFGKL